MSTVYSKRLSGPQLLTAAATVQFTVPAGRVYIVRSVSIVLQTTGAGAANRFVFMSNGTSSSANRLFRRNITIDTTELLDVRWVFNAGETLTAVVFSVTGNDCTLTTHGYDLDA